MLRPRNSNHFKLKPFKQTILFPKTRAHLHEVVTLDVDSHSSEIVLHFSICLIYQKKLEICLNRLGKNTPNEV